MPTITTTALAIAGIAALWLIWEDFRHRAVSVWAIGAVGIAGLLQLFAQFQLLWLDCLLNLLLLSLMLLLIRLYFRLRRVGKFMDAVLGWGDLAFLYALTPWFRVEEFFLLYFLATGTAILGYLLLHRRQAQPTIPLVAYLALAFLCMQGCSLLGWPLHL